MVTPHYRTLRSCWKVLVLVFLCFSAVDATLAQTPEPSIESVFAGVPFDKWLAEGPHQQVPWEVRISARFLSIHQRLTASVEIQVSGTELINGTATITSRYWSRLPTKRAS